MELKWRREWDAEQDCRLLELLKGSSFSEIEKENHFPGRTRSSLIGRYRRLVSNGRMTIGEVAERACRPKAHAKLLTTVEEVRQAQTHVSIPAMVQPKPSIPLPTSSEVYRPSRPKTLFELEDGDCRFPLPAEPGAAISHVFCGEPAVINSSYCKRHAFCTTRG